MKKILFLVGLLFLFSINTAVAEAPSKPAQITNWTPVIVKSIPRAHPKILTPPVIITYTTTVEAAKAYAREKIGSVQFACLDKLFTKESHWRVNAYNKYSGAYGIPQAVPGSKMALAGSDWRTNPITQVKWGLGYIKARYGSACGAWSHSVNYGWY